MLFLFHQLTKKNNKEHLDSNVSSNNINIQEISERVTTNNIIYPGIIVPYNKQIPPPGWVLCDGQNETPDLRSRFILGSGAGPGLTIRSLNSKGGMEIHDVKTENIQGGLNLSQMVATFGTFYTADTTGGPSFGYKYNSPDDNLPPYYILTYIMKK